MIDSLEGYDDMYALRMAIEPACILSPRLRPDRDQLAALRREQQAILDGGHRTLAAAERFESNARLHEGICSWSGNGLALQTLRRLDQLRRLAEYRQAAQPLPRRALAEEHLAILDAVEGGDTMLAASLMRQHIDAARRLKAVVEVFDRQPRKVDR